MLITLIIAWNTKTCCFMLSCERKCKYKTKTLISFKQIKINVFYPTASIQGAYVICCGGQGGGIPGQTGTGAREQEMGTKLGTGSATFPSTNSSTKFKSLKKVIG